MVQYAESKHLILMSRRDDWFYQCYMSNMIFLITSH